jgi:hypothetical protein
MLPLLQVQSINYVKYAHPTHSLAIIRDRMPVTLHYSLGPADPE